MWMANMSSSGRRGKAGDHVGQNAEEPFANAQGAAQKMTRVPEVIPNVSPVLPSGAATTTTESANWKSFNLNFLRGHLGFHALNRVASELKRGQELALPLDAMDF
jgi:hypothetical protein